MNRALILAERPYDGVSQAFQDNRVIVLRDDVVVDLRASTLLRLQGLPNLQRFERQP